MVSATEPVTLAGGLVFNDNNLTVRAWRLMGEV